MSNKQEYLIEINGDASKLESAINQANGKLQLLQGHKYKLSMDVDMDQSAYDRFVKQVNNKKLKVQIQYDRTKSTINAQKGILNDANLFNRSFQNGLKSSNVDSIIKNRLYAIKKDISNGIYDLTSETDKKQIQDRITGVSDIVAAAKIKSKGSYKIPEDVNKQLSQMLVDYGVQDYKGNIFKYNSAVREAESVLKESQQRMNAILSGTTSGANNSKFIDKTGKTIIDMTQKSIQNRINAKAKQVIDQAIDSQIESTPIKPDSKDRQSQVDALYRYFNKYGMKTSASSINRVDRLKNILDNSTGGDYSYFDEQYQKLMGQFDNQVSSYFQKSVSKYSDYAQKKLSSNRYVGGAETALHDLDNSIQDLYKFKGQNGLFDFSSDQAVNSLKRYRDAVKQAEQECSKASNILSNPISNEKLSTQINDFINRNKKLSSSFVSDLKKIDSQLKNSTTQQDFENYLLQFQRIKQEADKQGMIGGNTLKEQISDSLKNSTANLIANFFSYQDIMRYAKQIASTVTEINSAQTELQKVSDASNRRIQQNFKTSAATAHELGATISDVITDTADWSRLGYSIDQSENLAKTTQLFQNVGDNMSRETAQNTLVGAMKAYNINPQDSLKIVDKYNETANNFAINTEQLADGISRSGSALNAAGNSLDQSIAMMIAGNDSVQNSQTVGRQYADIKSSYIG